jgi:pilus assembly protein CpaF
MNTVPGNINKVRAFLEECFHDPELTEVMINSPDEIFIENENGFSTKDVKFSASDISNFINMAAAYNNKICDISHPIMDGILPGHARIHIVHPPVSLNHPVITVRKLWNTPRSFSTHHDLFGLSAKWIDLVKAMIRARFNILISGATSSGKSTLLDTLLNEVPPSERIIIMEDTRELSLSRPNVIRMECTGHDFQNKINITMRDLIRNSLRMRPDRIIIGEVRGPEAYDLIQAMNTGHRGALCTIHSNSARDALIRLETLALTAATEMPLKAVRRQMASSFDFLIHLTKLNNGHRAITQIAEISGMEAEIILSHNIGELKDNSLCFTGSTPIRAKELKMAGGLSSDFFNDKF